MSEDKHNDLAIALYTQAMEDLRHRAKVEWQTFAVLNVVYIAGIKILIDLEKCFVHLGQRYSQSLYFPTCGFLLLRHSVVMWYNVRRRDNGSHT